MDTLGPQDPMQGGSPVAAPAPDTSAPSQPAPAAPQKPQLWKTIVTSVLDGLAGSAGSTSFGGGLAKGTAGALNAQAQRAAQVNENQQQADAHDVARAKIASTYADIAHTHQIMLNMPPDFQTAESEKLAARTDDMLAKGLVVPQGPATNDWHEAENQAAAMRQKDPFGRLIVTMPIHGKDGKVVWQAMESPNSPLQSDVDIKLPDGTPYTIKAGSMTARDAMSLQVQSIKQDIANQSTKKSGSAAMKVVPDSKSKTGYSYAALGDDGKLSDIKGDAPAPSAQTFSQTKTTTVLGADGRPQVFAFNPQTKRFDQSVGYSASGHMGTVSEQAAAVNDAGEDLIKEINASRADFGTLAAWVKKHGLNTPVADPKLAGLQSSLSTFAALQPALHGFRSHDAMKEFQSIIGGVQNNPDAAIASIRAIQRTAASVNPELKKPSTATVKLKAPDGSVKEFTADEARYYIARGAKVVK